MSAQNWVFTLRLFQEHKSHYRTLTKTRKYVVDGQVVTTTTSKIVISGEENKSREEYEFRFVSLILNCRTPCPKQVLSWRKVLFEPMETVGSCVTLSQRSFGASVNLELCYFKLTNFQIGKPVKDVFAVVVKHLSGCASTLCTFTFGM